MDIKSMVSDLWWKRNSIVESWHAAFWRNVWLQPALNGVLREKYDVNKYAFYKQLKRTHKGFSHHDGKIGGFITRGARLVFLEQELGN